MAAVRDAGAQDGERSPATITVTARPIGFSGKLEEAVYEWTLPEGQS